MCFFVTMLYRGRRLCIGGFTDRSRLLQVALAVLYLLIERCTGQVPERWLLRMPLPTDNGLTSVAYGGGVFVTVGFQGTILVSDDGLKWTNSPIGVANDLYSIAYGGSRFVAVGTTAQGAGVVLSTTNGLGWNQQWLAGSTGLNKVAYGAGTYVALGRSEVWTSADASKWTLSYSALNQSLGAVSFGNGLFVAVGKGLVLTSSDGISWEEQSLGMSETLTGVEFGEGAFLAVGSQGTVLVSQDGKQWTQRSFGVSSSVYFRSLSYANGLFAASVADQFQIYGLLSKDGLTWTKSTAANPAGSNALAYGRGLYVLANGLETSADG